MRIRLGVDIIRLSLFSLFHIFAFNCQIGPHRLVVVRGFSSFPFLLFSPPYLSSCFCFAFFSFAYFVG